MLQIKNTLGGGKPEGLYAWKKHSLNAVEKATSTNATTKLSDATNATITYYTSSSYTFDEATGLFALDNPTEATLPYGSSKSMSNNIYFIVGSPSGETMFKGTSNDTSRLTQLRNNSNGLLVEPYSSSYTYTVYTAEQEATFLDYVVSDKETAYPDGGEKGWYWYERVGGGLTPEMFGCTKMAVDTFTLSSRTACYNHTISHSLGEMPKYVFLISEAEAQANNDVSFGIGINLNLVTNPEGVMTAHKIGSEMEYNRTGGFYPINSTSIKFNISNSYYWMAGIKYTVITMA